MAIKKGDVLIMSQQGIDVVVSAAADENEGLVQIKNKGTHSPCPVTYLHEPWVLTDPSGQDLDSGGPIFIQPDGQTTADPKEAKLFKDPDEAKRFRDHYTGIPYLEPRKLGDFQHCISKK